MGSDKDKNKEKDYYKKIKERMEELFKSKVGDVYLEITANGFSNKLKEQIPDNRHLIFSFLGQKGVRPDITGFTKENYFIVMEIKNEEIKLDYVYQLKKYAQLFDAKYAFLVSTFEIPAEIKKLDKIIFPYLLSGGYGYERLVLIHFDPDTGEFIEWYEKNPFKS